MPSFPLLPQPPLPATPSPTGRDPRRPTAPAGAPPAPPTGAPRSGIVPAGKLLGELAADPRLPAWIRRALFATAAGLILGLWVDWRLGLTAAIVTALGHTIYSFRTRAIIPAAARTTSAQRRTRRRLARLAPAGYVCLHARMVPGTSTVIDHLVVGPAGVFALDSLRWDRRLPVRTSQGRLYHGPFDQTGCLDQVRRAGGQASALIGRALGQEVTVHTALVIHGPVVPWIVTRIAGVDVFRGRRLRGYLRRQASANRARRLGDRQIELVHAVAAQVLPPLR